MTLGLLIGPAAVTGLLLAVYGGNLVYLSARALRLRPPPAGRVPLGAEPRVCVQVPIYNERYVAGRVVAAVCALDWPRDRLQVQVLDDSDDATVAAVAEVVAGLRREGFDIAHVRRGTRAGFKAGALAHGYAATDAPYIAVFDADFVPPADFLRRLMSAFDAPDVGWVQARWGHLNETYSLFTRLQALMIDFHFLVEQAVRPAHGYPTNFTGTAGVWRREAIEAGGGWSARTVAEDLDLSYRVQLAGWRGVFLEDVVAPQELPVAAVAYRGQQLRWATGTFQCAALLLPALLRSPLRPAARFQGGIRLLAYCAPLLMLLQVLLYPLLLVASPGGPALPLALLANLLSLAPAVGMTAAQVRRGRGWWRPLPAVLAWSLLGAGTSLTIAAGLFRALRPQAFNRTPKFRIEREGEEWRDHDYVVAVDPFAPVELLLAAALAVMTAVAAGGGHWLVAAYSGLFAAGFTLLGGTSLVQTLQVLTLRRLGRHSLELGQRAARGMISLAPAAALLVVVAGLGVAFEDSYAHWLVAATLASGGGLHDPLFGMEDTWLPAYHVLAAGVLLVFGLHSLWALRALSIGLGLATLVLVMRLAGDARRGRRAAALLVLNPAFLLTFTSAVAEPLMTSCLVGCAAALQARRLKLASTLAAAACLTGTKAWIWLGVAVAGQAAVVLLGSRRPRPALGWAVPALAALALLQLAFAPAEHSVARASLEVASATERGTVAAGVLGRTGAFTGWFALATLPALALAPLGLVREVRARASSSLLLLHLPALGYLAIVTALVGAGLYSGSQRYYVLALPSLSLLAATGLEALPAAGAVLTTAAAALLALAYAPVLADFASENAGLLAAGRAVAAVPGGLLTDSPAAAFASGKPPAAISGSRALPGSAEAATGWLRERGIASLVLEDVSYYRASSVYPGLVDGRGSAPFVGLGAPGAYDVAGGKRVSAWALPPGPLRAPVATRGWLALDPETEPRQGKTASLEKGVTIEVGGREAAGEGMGFGVPVVHFADGWVYAGSATTAGAGGPGGIAWRKTFDLDQLEVDGPDGRFTRFQPVPSRGRVVVEYRFAGETLHITARAEGLAGFDRVILLNEESAAFDDYADAAVTRRGDAVGPATAVTGDWARLRSSALGLEFALERVPGVTMRAGREIDAGRGLDWAGVGYEVGPDFTSIGYDVSFRRAR